MSMPPRHIAQILAIACLLALAVTVATVVAHRERARAGGERAIASAHAADELQKHFLRSADGLNHIRITIGADGASAAFSRPSEIIGDVTIVAWSPRVGADQRARFERTQGRRITEAVLPGAPQPAPARADYFPVTHLAGPGSRSRGILGLDIAAEPIERATLEAARDGGDLRISSPVAVMGGAGPGVLLMVPVYRDGARPSTVAGRRAAVRGVVIGAEPLSDFATAMKRELPPGARVQVFEGRKRLLGPTGLEDAGEASIALGGMIWRVRIAVAAGEPSYAFPLVLLGAGLALAVLMAALLRQAARRERASLDFATEIAVHAERHRAVVETAPDAIITIDERRRIESLNPATERLFGYRAEELVGENVSILMDEPDRSRHDGYVARYLTTGEARVIGMGREVDARRKDGSIFPAHLSVSEMSIAGRRMFTGIISDLSTQRRAEEALRATALERAMAAEQGALSRVATAVAAGATPEALFARVAEEVARLLGVEAGIVARFGTGEEAESVGCWGAGLGEAAITFPLDGRGALAEVRRTGLPARVASYESLAGEQIARIAQARGYTASVAAPVRVAGELWGAVLATTTRADPIPAAAEARLARFAELVGIAIANAEDRARLVEMATSDPLTGLANHGAFFERLNIEVERARRHGRPLSLAILDIDHFKRVNDTYGHPEGDRVLIEVARRLEDLARSGDTLARIGGEEFAWLQPESDGGEAQIAAERARREIGDAPFAQVGHLSISAGVCELAQAANAVDLMDLADRALYRAKAGGRDLVVRYGPDDERVAGRQDDGNRPADPGALLV